MPLEAIAIREKQEQMSSKGLNEALQVKKRLNQKYLHCSQNESDYPHKGQVGYQKKEIPYIFEYFLVVK